MPCKLRVKPKVQDKRHWQPFHSNQSMISAADCLKTPPLGAYTEDPHPRLEHEIALCNAPSNCTALLRIGLSTGPSVIWDLWSRPVGRRNVSQIMEGPVLLSFSYLKQSSDFFHVLEIATGWVVPSAGQKIPVQLGCYLPRRSSHLCWKQVSSGK